MSHKRFDRLEDRETFKQLLAVKPAYVVNLGGENLLQINNLLNSSKVLKRLKKVHGDVEKYFDKFKRIDRNDPKSVSEKYDLEEEIEWETVLKKSLEDDKGRQDLEYFHVKESKKSKESKKTGADLDLELELELKLEFKNLKEKVKDSGKELEIVRSLKSGGSGETDLCFIKGIEGLFVAKTYNKGYVHSDEYVIYWIDRDTILEKINIPFHENIVPIICEVDVPRKTDTGGKTGEGGEKVDVGTERGILMKYHQHDLEEYLDIRGKVSSGRSFGEDDENNFPILTPVEFCSIMRGIINGAAHLHEHFVVHRDLHLGNIFIDEKAGRILIGDFGIALSMLSEKKKKGTWEVLSNAKELDLLLSSTSKRWVVGGASQMFPPEVGEVVEKVKNKKKVDEESEEKVYKINYEKYDLYSIGQIGEVLLKSLKHSSPGMSSVKSILGRFVQKFLLDFERRISFEDAKKEIKRIFEDFELGELKDNRRFDSLKNPMFKETLRDWRDNGFVSFIHLAVYVGAQGGWVNFRGYNDKYIRDREDPFTSLMVGFGNVNSSKAFSKKMEEFEEVYEEVFGEHEQLGSVKHACLGVTGLAQEEIEKEKIDQEKIDQEKIDQEKIEQEKIDQEKIEQEKIDKEKKKKDKVVVRKFARIVHFIEEDKDIFIDDLPLTLFPRDFTTILNDLEAINYGIISKSLKGKLGEYFYNDYFADEFDVDAKNTMEKLDDVSYYTFSMGAGLGNGILHFVPLMEGLKIGGRHVVLKGQLGHTTMPPDYRRTEYKVNVSSSYKKKKEEEEEEVEGEGEEEEDTKPKKKEVEEEGQEEEKGEENMSKNKKKKEDTIEVEDRKLYDSVFNDEKGCSPTMEDFCSGRGVINLQRSFKKTCVEALEVEKGESELQDAYDVSEFMEKNQELNLFQWKMFFKIIQQSCIAFPEVRKIFICGSLVRSLHNLDTLVRCREDIKEYFFKNKPDNVYWLDGMECYIQSKPVYLCLIGQLYYLKKIMVKRMLQSQIRESVKKLKEQLDGVDKDTIDFAKYHL